MSCDFEHGNEAIPHVDFVHNAVRARFCYEKLDNCICHLSCRLLRMLYVFYVARFQRYGMALRTI